LNRTQFVTCGERKCGNDAKLLKPQPSLLMDITRVSAGWLDTLMLDELF